MSVRELRQLVTELKHNKDEIVKKEVQAIKTENNLLRQELKEWDKIIPEAKKDCSKAEKQLLYAQTKYDEFEAALSYLSFREAEIEDGKIGAEIEAMIRKVNARILHFHEKWEAHKRGDA